MSVIIKKETSPHLRRKDSLFRMLLDVCIALFPVTLMAIISYTWRAVIILAISMITMVGSEIVFVLIKNRVPYDGKKHSLKEHLKKGFSALNINNIMAPILSAEIFALIMPTQSNPEPVVYVATFVGALVGMVIGKLVFGGTGQNIFNPAAVGMVFAKICFGSHYVYPSTHYVTAISTSGTPLTYAMGTGNSLIEHFSMVNDYSTFDMFFGRIPGVMGEGFKIAILIGMVYLIIRKTVDWRVLASFFGTFLVLMGIAGIFVAAQLTDVSWLHFMAFQLFTGGVMFGGVYMLTDPVTMPINSPGRLMYGMIAASLTVFIRLFAAYPEGMVFAILLSNMLAPVLDYHAWSGQAYTWKKILIMVSIFVVSAGIVALVLGLGGAA